MSNTPEPKIAANSLNLADKAIAAVSKPLSQIAAYALNRPKFVSTPVFLSAYVFVVQVNGGLKKLQETMRKAVVAAHETESLKEVPGYSVEVRIDKQRKPSWKNEAIKQAALVAKLKGKKFSEDGYIARIAAATPVSESKTVEIKQA